MRYKSTENVMISSHSITAHGRVGYHTVNCFQGTHQCDNFLAQSYHKLDMWDTIIIIFKAGITLLNTSTTHIKVTCFWDSHTIQKICET